MSSLRVVDIFLSSASQTSGVDVWFVLLQKPRLDSGEAVPSGAGGKSNFYTNIASCLHLSSGKEPDLDNAFDKLLATFESDYQISLHFGAQRRMLVTVKEASLEQVQEAVHPAAR